MTKPCARSSQASKNQKLYRMYVCIYIYIERERDAYTLFIYIYIYTYHSHLLRKSRTSSSPRATKAGVFAQAAFAPNMCHDNICNSSNDNDNDNDSNTTSTNNNNNNMNLAVPFRFELLVWLVTSQNSSRMTMVARIARHTIHWNRWKTTLSTESVWPREFGSESFGLPLV